MQIDVANGLKIANMNKPKREENEEKKQEGKESESATKNTMRPITQKSKDRLMLCKLF